MRSVSGKTVDDPALMMSPLTADGSTSGSRTSLCTIASVAAAGGEVGSAGALVVVAGEQAARSGPAANVTDNTERRTVGICFSLRRTCILPKPSVLPLRLDQSSVKTS